MECHDWRAFAMLCAGVFVIMMDQNLMAPNLSQIAGDFGFDDTERDVRLGGHISVAFFLLGLPAALVIGVLTDVIQRKRILVWTMILGQGPCVLALFVSNYWELFAIRTLTGIAVGGALPIVYSMVGDLFPANSRSYASMLVGMAMNFGGMFGQGVAGYLGPSFGWRVPFAVVGTFGLAVAAVVQNFAVEPRRGVADGGDGGIGASAAAAAAAASAKTASLSSHRWSHLLREWLKKSAAVFRRRTNVLGFLQGIPGCVPWSIIGVFMNDYLAVDKGLGVEHATTIMMFFGFGGMFGTITGGILGQKLYNLKPWYMTAYMGAAAIAGIFPWLYLVEADDYGTSAEAMGEKIGVMFFAGLLATMTGVNVRTVIVNVNAPYERGTAFAWFNLTDDLGKGFGPVMSSALVAHVGRTLAFKLGFGFWAPCGALCLLCGWTMPRDVNDVRREMQELAEGRSSPRREGDVGGGGGDVERTSLLGRGVSSDKLV